MVTVKKILYWCDHYQSFFMQNKYVEISSEDFRLFACRLNHWALILKIVSLHELSLNGRPKQLWETNHGGRQFSKIMAGRINVSIICKVCLSLTCSLRCYRSIVLIDVHNLCQPWQYLLRFHKEWPLCHELQNIFRPKVRKCRHSHWFQFLVPVNN